MTELVGLVGSVAFAISGVPAAYHAFRDRSCSYPRAFLGLWATGEGLMILYAILTHQPVLLVNYIPNGLCLLTIIRYNK